MSADVEITHGAVGARVRRRSARAAPARCGPASARRGPGARLAAPAFPVHCTSGDNLAIHVAVARAAGG